VQKRVESALERPVLKLWISHLRRSIGPIPKPRDAPRAHAAGSDSVRILLAGSGLAVGHGVLSHRLGFGGSLANQLAAAIGRGVDVDIHADPEMTVQRCRRELDAMDLDRYDAVVLTIGLREALNLTAPDVWREDVCQLMRDLDARGVTTFVVGIPSSVQSRRFVGGLQRYIRQQASLLDDIMKQECEQGYRLVFVPLGPIPGRRFAQAPTSKTYQQWAKQVVPAVAPLLRHSEVVGGGQNEQDRQRALEALRILDTDAELRFDSYAKAARSLFRTWGAAITFLDHDRQWTKAASGPERGDSPRVEAFCDVTIQSDSVFVVEDATLDPRFHDNPKVTGPGHIRFYAGYPIETPGGLRVGALCILDTEPRTFSKREAALLRDLALSVQQEVWAPGPSA
jgi:hypothetical protein